MDATIKAVVEAIHASPTQAVLFISGGASQALGWLLSVPRASRTVLEARVPYSKMSMLHLLHKVPSQYVNSEVADEVALAAYNHALTLSRCHIAARTQSCILKYDLVLSKGWRDRFGEENVTSRLLIKAVSDICGITMTVPLDLDEIHDTLHASRSDFTEDEQLDQLVNGETCMISYSGKQSPIKGRRFILSGSFNPLHEGHLKLLDAACSVAECVPCFEMSAINADKPPLTVNEIKKRVGQFTERGKTIIVTNQPFFYKKAELLADSSFVIGIDTAIRLIDPKYYEGSHAKMLEVLMGIQKLGCDFIVAGRKVAECYQTLEDVQIPAQLRPMFKAIPKEDFRADISSTELRQKPGWKLGML
ncbi:hypothetical protein O6H91_16G080600 [Diphasiastrum complanatum]|uniref:Uncharacterized protein n=1 Tax=Diphasiastrum complanatum TaxID=34168 RepID=A0ACC2BE70_DIPCM|nr:hypothetical protein O6H91_16G080600 [Diphasiastrum complanatum]